MYEFKFIPQQKVVDWKSVVIFKYLENIGWIHMDIPRKSLLILYKLFSNLQCITFFHNFAELIE